MTMRIGHGYDVHACGQGSHIVLGGTTIECGFGLIAHSDGDVVLHAICATPCWGPPGSAISADISPTRMSNFEARIAGCCCKP